MNDRTSKTISTYNLRSTKAFVRHYAAQSCGMRPSAGSVIVMMPRAARLAVGHVGHRPIAEITRQSVSFIIVPSFTSKHEDCESSGDGPGQ